MATVADYLIQLNKLTKTNLEILSGINQSFFTRQEHLEVRVDDQRYVMPSFLSLENKVNALQESLENLTHIQESGEAYLNIDGSSRALMLRSYTNTPPSLTLPEVSTFSVTQNDVFKDFLTPVPWLNFSLEDLSNDITSVRVLKVIPLSDDLRAVFRGWLAPTDELPEGPTSKQVSWGDIKKTLDGLKEDVDYTLYERTYKMPVRKNIGQGQWIIQEIVSDEVDENLDNYITVRLYNSGIPSDYRTDLTYTLFDQTIQRSLKEGDRIVTWDDSAKLEVVQTIPSTNSLKLKVLNGEYLNLAPYSGTGEVPEYARLRFFSPIDFNSDKYLHVPLEEDDLLFIALAPLNDRMNVQSPWGSGLVVNTSLLRLDDAQSGTLFPDYYRENVRNIGDILNEISQMTSNSLSTQSPDTFTRWTGAVPTLQEGDYEVVQINAHLNNSTTVKNIRSLYSQKKQLKSQLDEVSGKIQTLQATLADVSFDDTSGLRTSYESQLTEYNSQYNELATSITKILDQIAQEANESEVPIENAKYRVRGFVNQDSFTSQEGLSELSGHICGMEYMYRYKNVDQTQGNARAINDQFVFSDWVRVRNIDPRVAKYSGKFVYGPEYEGYNTNNLNVPSFNQIDIPITQGETVDVKVRLIYDYGQPFVMTTSAWSQIVNIGFPEEYTKNVEILDIISENNSDIETNRFRNIIEEQGIPDHINDKLIDQSITYFHKPESIASGFYTDERRIIPLRDKLSSMDAAIIQLQDEILGTSADAIQVSVGIGDAENVLVPWQTNKLSVQDWTSLKASAQETEGNSDNGDNVVTVGSYEFNTDTNVASVVLNLTLTNISERTIKLYSMFPGDRTKRINDLAYVRFNQEDYCDGTDDASKGVWIRYTSENAEAINLKLQNANQFITFRINDANDGQPYYKGGEQRGKYNLLSLDKQYISAEQYEKSALDPTQDEGYARFAWMYPMLKDEWGITLDGDTSNSFLTLAPGDQLIVPIVFEYIVDDSKKAEGSTGVFTAVGSVTKTMSFDLRTSLYTDPVNYIFQVTAKNVMKVADKLVLNNSNKKGLKVTSLYNTKAVAYKPVIIK